MSSSVQQPHFWRRSLTLAKVVIWSHETTTTKPILLYVTIIRCQNIFPKSILFIETFITQAKMIHEFLDLYELQLIQSRHFPMPIMNLSTHPVLNEDQLSKKDFLQSLRCRHDQLVRFFVCASVTIFKRSNCRKMSSILSSVSYSHSFFATTAWKSFAFPSICLFKRIVGSRSFISLRRFSKVNKRHFYFAIETFKF